MKGKGVWGVGVCKVSPGLEGLVACDALVLALHPTISGLPVPEFHSKATHSSVPLALHLEAMTLIF